MVHTKSVWLGRMLAPAFLFLAIGDTAFGKEKVRVYTIPKEHPPIAQAAPGTDSNIPTTDTSASPVHWTTPTDWKELPPTSVRIGNFLVSSGEKKAEVTITSFPGDVGGELSNINRWRRELGLGPVTEKEVSSIKTMVGSSEAKLYDFSGDAARTIVAWLQREGSSWFFKLRGDKGLVAASQKTFLEFLKSIHFGAAEATSRSADGNANPHGDAGQLPAGHPEISGDTKVADTKESGAEPKWTVPSNWKEKPPGMMVLKSFSVESSGGQANIAISSFPGEVGGKLGNVNRWRGQMGLPKIEAADLDKETQSIDVVGGKATLVDVKGTDAKSGKAARLVAVMVPHAEETWFYKLLGDDATVGAEKENFVKFVKTVRY